MVIRGTPVDQDGLRPALSAAWTDGGMFDFLCIGRLEARLGRQLTAADFPAEVPMNFDSRDWRSERLQARLREGA